jgi:hypothetical protein
VVLRDPSQSEFVIFLGLTLSRRFLAREWLALTSVEGR